MPRIRFTAPGATAALIVAGAALRLIAAQSVGLGVSEAYYFGAARHLSLSYFDHPPAAAVLAWTSLTVAGHASNLVLRLPFVALFCGTTWLMFLTGRRLFGPWAGFFSALLLNLTPVFALSAGMFFQPDGPLMFFWLATVYVLAPVLVDRAAWPDGRRRWLLAGTMLGLALLSKYTAIFLAGGALLWILSGRDRRHWLARPEPYLAFAVALVVFAPVLVWNARHGWISFLWQGARAADYQGFHLSWLLHNIGGQIVEVSPWIWGLLVLEPFRAMQGSAGRQHARRFMLCVGLPPIVVYSAVAAYADVGNHFHWGTPGYLTLLLGLGATVDGWFRQRAKAALAGLIGIASASVMVMVVANVQAATGWFSAGGGSVARWLADGNDPTVELIDYDELRSTFAARGWLTRDDLFVFSDRHYVAGKVDYALRGQLPFLVLSDDPRAYAFFESPAHFLGFEGILVSRRNSLEAVDADYAGYCSTVEPLEPVPITRREVVEITLYLYSCRRLTTPYPLPYGLKP